LSSHHDTQCYLNDIVTAVPEAHLQAKDAMPLLQGVAINTRSARLLRRLLRLTGIKKRHLAILDHQTTLADDDALYRPASEQPHGPGMLDRGRVFNQAASELVKRLLAQLSTESIAEAQTLITVSCTHASSPGLELPVFLNAPLNADVQRWNLGFMGCSAALAAMRLVHRATSGTSALVVCCELSSLHFQYTDQIDQMTANLLFADGAAAMILGPRPSRIKVLDCCCSTFAPYADQMVWEAGDHGLRLHLSPELPDTLADHLPAAVDALLDANDLDRTAIDHWLVHPGGPQILDAVESSLGLSAGTLGASREVLGEYGNMSSPTILFILKHCIDRAQGHVVLVAFGPGLTIELALLHVR
jgi:predicted naringenin-chalcone synthase